MYFKLNLLSNEELDKKIKIDNFPRTNTEKIIENLNNKFKSAVESTMSKNSSNVKEKDKTLYSFYYFLLISQ